MAITKPILLDETGQEMIEVLREVKTAIASGKDSEITTWKTVRANVRAGLGSSLYPAGTKFIVYKYANGATKTGTPSKYYLDVVGHNVHFLKRHGVPTADYSMSLQFHELLADGMLFDAPEDLYGLSLDSSVVAWKTYYSNTSGTVVSNPTGSPRDNGYYEKNHADRVSYGSNNWRNSAIRKWLNADKNLAAGAWWSKTTANDKQPSYVSILPFQALLADDVNGVESTLLDVIGPVTIESALSTVKRPDAASYFLDCDADGKYDATRAAYDTTEDTFFLPSTKEVHCSTYNEPDGECLEYYSRFSDYANPIVGWGSADTNLLKHKLGTSSATIWWLRSAYTSYARSAMRVGSDGAVLSSYAYDAHGVGPLCVIY